mmetsp:Transcript_20935/g.41785  ORF Transcript_20935/g.41785 Transcript_20935/m.41785 type:complete len:97 (-) Transcript_20935:2927-3217(-)
MGREGHACTRKRMRCFLHFHALMLLSFSRSLALLVFVKSLEDSVDISSSYKPLPVCPFSFEPASFCQFFYSFILTVNDQARQLPHQADVFSLTFLA